ncbi:poly(U)-specific 3'-to-5' RNA exonuclease [Cadophora gregata]|uniref:poly(U)-specific 3'-to-5' RNA exonuclease n=1 Tax=Cadophora gregata TaxID=51156 RepID=UPI0026DA8633|nr:poly(U)-specific 3'-to-5' RNA exonuclease [Cadophora gregata]KAK0118157.1 poly(U)-specific 3'-to-5' RNA exonuclease [Cadophora gregata]KAK0123230.1 poly(U)-specific 3'-to-5' RNA exonuclease [Cadophora gregata f. sp. sojae]
MALVDYPSSDEEEDEDTATLKSSKESSTLKRNHEEPSNLPPLPSKFHDLYASTTRVSIRDDPSLHEGRKRVIPHIEGNWPTHIYIEWYPSTTEDASLSKLISALQKEISLDSNSKVHSSVTSDVGVPLPLHVSLSRSLGFLAPQKDEFVDSLGRVLKVSGIRPFDITFTGLKWVANFERTRWFLVLSIPKPESDGLNKLLHVCNSVVKQYGQPPLYPKPPTGPAFTPRKKHQRRKSQENRRAPYDKSHSNIDWTDMQDATDALHISLAWTLQSPSQELLELTDHVAKDHLDLLQKIEVSIAEIKCKVGNIVTSMPLPRHASEHE